jgi:hypothetical protein
MDFTAEFGLDLAVLLIVHLTDGFSVLSSSKEHSGMQMMKRLVLLLSIVLGCYSCIILPRPRRLPPGKRVVRQVVEVDQSKDDLFEAVYVWLLEFIEVKRFPPESFSKGVPTGPSLEYQNKKSGRLVAKAQIWVDYPSEGRHLTDFVLTILVQQGRYLITAEDPRFWNTGKRVPWGSVRYSEGKTGPRYSFPGLWRTSAVDTEKMISAFRSEVLEAFGLLETAVKGQVRGTGMSH